MNDSEVEALGPESTSQTPSENPNAANQLQITEQTWNQEADQVKDAATKWPPMRTEPYFLEDGRMFGRKLVENMPSWTRRRYLANSLFHLNKPQFLELRNLEQELTNRREELQRKDQSKDGLTKLEAAELALIREELRMKYHMQQFMRQRPEVLPDWTAWRTERMRWPKAIFPESKPEKAYPHLYGKLPEEEDSTDPASDNDDTMMSGHEVKPVTGLKIKIKKRAQKSKLDVELDRQFRTTMNNIWNMMTDWANLRRLAEARQKTMEMKLRLRMCRHNPVDTDIARRITREEESIWIAVHALVKAAHEHGATGGKTFPNPEPKQMQKKSIRRK